MSCRLFRSCQVVVNVPPACICQLEYARPSWEVSSWTMRSCSLTTRSVSCSRFNDAETSRMTKLSTGLFLSVSSKPARRLMQKTWQPGQQTFVRACQMTELRGSQSRLHAEGFAQRNQGGSQTPVHRDQIRIPTRAWRSRLTTCVGCEVLAITKLI